MVGMSQPWRNWMSMAYRSSSLREGDGRKEGGREGGREGDGGREGGRWKEGGRWGEGGREMGGGREGDGRRGEMGGGREGGREEPGRGENINQKVKDSFLEYREPCQYTLASFRGSTYQHITHTHTHTHT